ncbi:hypothetical protein [Leuconostoc gasicomitatum]|uniref:hypothetical protein n=1 Tax=Leuconostoc gasicomitatum TaxID=115778 RepID=UPI0007E20008|nr:hypothetical protein [Leuconostoc gasicomitatum]CUW06724.1 hypothetical protein PB1E_0742 [Leuconostoc gasicomitatum]
MAYTFDEAIEELRLAIPEKFYQPTMHDIAVILETQNKVVDSLRKEYAPTVEMTQSQYDELFMFKSNFSSKQLVTVVERSEPWCFLEELSARLWGHEQHAQTDKNIEDTMKAYLYPKNIKVIEEEAK